MNEDFRAKNIGAPRGRYAQSQRLKNLAKQAEASIAEFERERSERLKGRVHRPIIGVQISEDWGKTWKLRALCDECVSNIEPPMQRRKLGAAGSQSCDWCGALNEKQ